MIDTARAEKDPFRTEIRLPAPAEESEVNTMAKSLDAKKDAKKKPAKTLKEKKAEKKSKKAKD